MKAIDLLPQLSSIDRFQWYGTVKRVVGLTIEANGPKAAVGEVCEIIQSDGKHVRAEVVGFKENILLLMPFSKTARIQPGSIVKNTRHSLQIQVGDALIGKVLDGLGEPLDGQELPKGLQRISVDQEAPNPLTRPAITDVLPLGVRAIDGLLTMGVGQRVGIFAGSGVGKSTLLSMIARSSQADVNVIALIGERGREVKDFLENDLGEQGMKNTIVIVATSDQPALVRIKGAETATAIAEYFRDRGKIVNLMMDSVTRYAMAQREIGLATGEPPTTKGYTPSVFSMLPRVLERSGTNESGAITAFYTVLVDGDDLNEPIADAVRGILDGHIVLDRELANQGHFPAINVLKSVSRLMNQIVSTKHRDQAQDVRSRLAIYEETVDLIQVGAYKKGNDHAVDHAVDTYAAIKQFLRQQNDEAPTYEEAIESLHQV
ncbi:flagellar protein export ATPase FliI [Geomicrobium sediminis]|uniref:Flagellum-specific ATP synthase n=1 Tax=Geomicrobium sediminis TaxID=1347788 RepID=A0ABS2PBD5_9BACL|nr:flagellar protein export ATPase FliI [Geomicrobium sediminis]MBM7632592.1 flagellum-specific ATP synthase [Geomicrobium sediminis]